MANIIFTMVLFILKARSKGLDHAKYHINNGLVHIKGSQQEA